MANDTAAEPADKDLPAAAALASAAQALGVVLSPLQIGQLLAHLSLIRKWSRIYNLTAIRDAGDMLTQHTLDSLAVVAPLLRHLGRRPARVLDVGSGAGLPGVVVAICCPELEVDCVDTVGKKATFIRQVALELQLPHLRAHHARVESLAGPFDVITSRAFASLEDFVSLSRRALAPDGVWMALKGKRPDPEIAALPPEIEVFHVEQLTVPGLAAERCIVWLRQHDG